MESIKNLPGILFLCGFMGTGKSTLGRTLAEKLELPFADLDTRIEKQAGKPIPKIFEEEGEQRFRSLERKQLLDTIRNYEGVLALGGGALHNQHLVDHIKINGLLIFIETPFSVILDRIMQHDNRPLLLNEDGTVKDRAVLEEELSELYNQRLKYYRQAEITIRNDNETSIEDTAAALVKKIRNHVAHN
ncbi:shikimate kinase [Halalkalibaculum sp. DA384]|uniref:shikimate kinase n=1 Tax=Halalkalibaculum sp. DA384 TaxID=3373606 RepID=UPI003754BFF1